MPILQIRLRLTTASRDYVDWLSANEPMSYYQRNLPHWHPDGAPLFVTWRLFGSLPASRPHILPAEAPGQVFRAIDRELDRAACGPSWLKDPRVAECVAAALRFGQQQLGFYDLAAYVVMPNHVHALLRPHVSLARITGTVKGLPRGVPTKSWAEPVRRSGSTNPSTTGSVTSVSTIALWHISRTTQ